MKNREKASVSFIVPTLNEERNIDRCLASVAKQTYPHELIEVVIADACSSDATRAISDAWAKSCGITLRILENPRKVAEFGKAIAIQSSASDFIVMLDADNEIVQPDWLECALIAFDVFPDIYGYESYCLRIPNGKPITNYLACCRIFCDPLASDIAIQPSLLRTVDSSGLTYQKYHLPPGFPSGANGYIFRRDRIQHLLDCDTFEEGQVSLKLSFSEQPYFARIVGYGIYHHYTTSFMAFVRKRAKIAIKFTTRSQQHETWVDYTGKRLYIYAFLDLTAIYPLLYSVVQAIRRKEPLWLLHAPVCFLTVVSYAFNWIYVKVARKRAW